jgi:hypothetical protein
VPRSTGRSQQGTKDALSVRYLKVVTALAAAVATVAVTVAIAAARSPVASSTQRHVTVAGEVDQQTYVWTAKTVTELTPTTVRFFFKAKATKFLLLSGAGALMFPDAPAQNVVERAPAVQSTVIIHRRGPSSATFTVTDARYQFSTRIGVLFQAVGLIGQITRSTIRACRVGSTGAITVETEQNLPSSRRLFRVGSFADNGVVVGICRVRAGDPAAVAKIVATPPPKLESETALP